MPPEETKAPETPDVPAEDLTPEDVFGKIDKELGETAPPADEEPVEEPEEKPAEEEAEESEEKAEPKTDEFGIPAEDEIPADVEASGQSEELQATKAELDRLVEANNKLMGLLEKQKAPEEVPDERQQLETIAKKYSFSVGPELLGQIQSEDPAVVSRGLETLALGTALKVHKEVSDEFEERLGALEKRITGTVTQGQQQRQTADAATAFYKKYPGLDNPVIRGVVQQVAGKMVEAGELENWDDTSQLLLARRTAQVLKESGVAVGKVQKAKKQPFLGGGGPKNTQEGKEPETDPNSPDAIRQFAMR